VQLAIGIDLGGSHITAVMVDESGAVLARCGNPVVQHDFDTVFAAMIESAKTVMAAVPDCSTLIQAVGLGIPGNVDPRDGATRYLPSFPWGRIEIGKLFETQLQLPVIMRNDGRCAAIAESRLGSGRHSRIFALLTLGTGIGGALIIDGKLFDGATFDAGDFGHHTIHGGANGFPCVCGKSGCFEMHAAAQGLVRHYQKQGGSSADNAAQVMEKYRQGEDKARTAFACYLDDLSTGLANLVTFYNPDAIAVGGGLSHAPEVFENIHALVDAKTLPASRNFVKIVPATLGQDAGAIGAGLLALSSQPAATSL
jgi:glucokinase